MPEQQGPEEVKYVRPSEINLQGKLHPLRNPDVIQITEDRAYRHLSPWCRAVERSYSWIGPLSLTVSLWAALSTAEFKNKFGLPKETWLALFYGGAVAAAIWLIVSLFRRFKDPPLSVDRIIEKLRE